EAGRGHLTVLHAQHHPHPVAAERINVLGDRGRVRQLAAEARPPPALTDDVAVERGRRSGGHSSSPRSAWARYGGRRYAISWASSPPCPSPAISRLPTGSP